MARVDVDENAVRALVRGDVGRRAVKAAGEKVQAAAERAVAGILVEGEPGDTPLPVVGFLDAGGEEPRYVVGIPHPAALAVEAKHRPLGGALDAGGG